MRNLNGREVKVLVLLSVVIPVGILAGLRLTGIWHDPIVISETIMLETINWQYQIPNSADHIITINQHLISQHSSDEISVVFDFLVADYDTIPRDTVQVVTRMNSSARAGSFMESAELVFPDIGSTEAVIWDNSNDNLVLHNLALAEVHDGYSNGSALVRLTGANRPSNVYFNNLIYWYFASPSAGTRWLQASFQLTYYNGTAYKKIVQSYELEIQGG